MSKLARTIPVVAVVAALTAAPSGAGAATQVGQTVDPAGSFCSNNTTWLQSVSPTNGSFAVPFDGVITSWSFQGGDFVPVGLKFKLGRVGGTSLTIVGESSPVNPAANQLNTFPTQVTARTGDVIGFYTQFGGRCAALGQVGYTEVFANGDIPPGGMGSPITTEPQVHLDVSALLERDCDNDGLGDETQDTNLSTCAPGTTPTGPAPTLPSGAPATCRGKQATIVGTNGSDTRTGSRGPDVIVALGGNDTLSGIAGNDVICGGAGKDNLRGGKGKDSLLGQKGKDTLKGGGSRDFCKGGKGNDTASQCEVEKSI
jgi:Ca2+-binding RTX toxin-like protein